MPSPLLVPAMDTLYYVVVTIGKPRQRVMRRYRHMLVSAPSLAQAKRKACSEALLKYRELTGFYIRPLNARVEGTPEVICRTPDQVSRYGSLYRE